MMYQLPTLCRVSW